MDELKAPSFADIAAARRRLEGHAVRTPLLSAPALDASCGGRILVKAECLQRTGSFKFRGAWNFISQLPDSARDNGVVAFSSGNHGQAEPLLAIQKEGEVDQLRDQQGDAHQEDHLAEQALGEKAAHRPAHNFRTSVASV